ncbi:MAG: methyltransferase domain-containing protein [Akkermansiaceae bacterium]|nr:methyltransferase domain-containing protein [Armatimonadota bacterium]
MDESNPATLPPEAFRRYDESPDEVFYRTPRFVTHIDDGAITAVTQLYREFFPADGAILDLMSSWISHLPEETAYREVVGLGMNREELAANPRLSEFVVQNLNDDPTLPFAGDRFDAAAICVSVDYLTDPVAVLQEAARVLKPNAPIVITFSNRCFPTKAVAVWHSLDDAGRVQLVAHYLESAGGWTDIQTLDRSPANRRGDPLFAVVARRA